MAQASLKGRPMSVHSGEQEKVDTDEEDSLLGPDGEDSVTNGQIQPIVPTGQPTKADQPMDVSTTKTPTIPFTKPAEDQVSVTESMIQGMSEMGRPSQPTVKMTSKATVTVTDTLEPTQQYYQGKGDKKPKPLPFMMRTLVTLTTLMAAWVAGTYECPYPGCLWASQGTRRDDGTILRPDRWSDFLEHWYCLHMIPALVMKCTIQGCTSASRLFTCSRRLSEHVRGHFKDRKGQDDESRKPLKTALEIFSANAGAEPDMKALQRTIVYPAHHLTRKQYDSQKKAKVETEQRIAEEKEKKKQSEERLRKEAEEKKKDKKREDDRKARHASQSSKTRDEEIKGSQKRDHSVGSTATTSSNLPDVPHFKKAKTDLVAESLPVRSYERSISMECFRQVTGSFGALNLTWNTHCKTQMAAAEEKISECERDKTIVCQEVDRVRSNLNQFRNDIDIATSHMAYWQEDLGNTPAAIPPSKMLLCPSVLMEARQVPALKEKLNTTRTTVDKLSTDVKELLEQLDVTHKQLKESEQREKSLVERLEAMEIAATPLPPATFGGETTFLNRPTTRNEIALFQAQLGRMHEYWGQFH